MAKRGLVFVFVHGWSVTNTNTYGRLPVRLRNECAANNIDATTRHIFLGRYISFHDEVKVADVARAFRTALDDELGRIIKSGQRFVCITHSTGGPVVRDWWHRYYNSVPRSGVCPMSHLIMLAPANYGSALAQLGKGRISRLKSWFGGVEPGQGILDWLELGSDEAWALNTAWLETGESGIGAKGIFPFVLTGQSINRAFYDNLNTYTGEQGSDGVVRAAAANLRGRRISLVQQAPKRKPGGDGILLAPKLEVADVAIGPRTAMRIVRGAAHSGDDMGIMRSVGSKAGAAKGRDAVNAILDCIGVTSKTGYRSLVKRHDAETAAVQDEERLEIDDRRLLPDRHFIHDRCSMVIFRLRDTEGYPVTDFDLLLTAGKQNDPNKLPRGFFIDRQLNRRNRNTITYYFNYDVMVGAPEVRNGNEVIRRATRGADALGFRILPRPDDGFVHYLPCEIHASRDLLDDVLQPNATTLVDVTLKRIVRKNVFRLKKMTGDSTRNDFKRTRPGDDIAD